MRKKIIIILLISISLFSLFFTFILYPSHLSVVGACSPQQFEEKYSEDYYVAGYVDIIEESEEGEIITIFYHEGDIPAEKHEYVHVKQYKQGRLFSCKYPALRLLNEIEAYSVQRFWEIRLFFQDLFKE
jgi:hypothetical protein